MVMNINSYTGIGLYIIVINAQVYVCMDVVQALMDDLLIYALSVLLRIFMEDQNAFSEF